MDTMVFVDKASAKHLRLVNKLATNPSDLKQGDFTVVAGYAAIADEDVVQDAVGSFNVEGGILVQSAKLHTTATKNDFSTVGQDVFWHMGTQTFSAVSATGNWKVGSIVEVKDANGVIIFDKLRRAVLVA